jgi:hypothetical protein
VFVTGVVGDPANDPAVFNRQFAISVGAVAVYACAERFVRSTKEERLLYADRLRAALRN